MGFDEEDVGDRHFFAVVVQLVAKLVALETAFNSGQIKGIARRAVRFSDVRRLFGDDFALIVEQSDFQLAFFLGLRNVDCNPQLFSGLKRLQARRRECLCLWLTFRMQEEKVCAGAQTQERDHSECPFPAAGAGWF